MKLIVNNVVFEGTILGLKSILLYSHETIDLQFGQTTTRSRLLLLLSTSPSDESGC